MSSIVYAMSRAPRFMELEKEIQEHNKDKATGSSRVPKVPVTPETDKKNNCKKGADKKLLSRDTLKAYKNHAIIFAKWCRNTYGCKTLNACRAHIQDYANWLQTQGKSASTIHTYLAGVCCAYGIKLSSIEKPLRRVAENTRSRGQKASDSRKDTKRECSPRLYDFAKNIGIRRDEFGQLRGNDLCYDEQNYLCVRICKGKGGKMQLQRVPLGQEDFVRSYFDGTTNFVFSKGELNNKIDLHSLRHHLALKVYQGYKARLDTEPNYRVQLSDEIKSRCKAMGRERKFNPHEIQGTYWLHGKNAELARAAGFPSGFDRLAVMATSIFHLSHWRNDVTVDNYILGAIQDILRSK